MMTSTGRLLESDGISGVKFEPGKMILIKGRGNDI